MRSFFVYIVAGCMVFFSGCATVPSKGTTRNLQDLCQKHNIELEWDSVSQVIKLNRGQVDGKCLIGSDMVIVAGEKIALSQALYRDRNAIIVPFDFEDKVIPQFLEYKITTKKKTYKVIVDAGHGGKDPGAVSRSGLKEKEIVLDIAKRLKEKLKDQGFSVDMTRTGDQFLSLGERTEIASQGQPDLFISIHANASPQRSVQGLEVYILRELTSRERREEQRLKNSHLLFKGLEMDGHSEAEEIIEDMLYSYKRAESNQLAKHLASEAAKMAKSKNRGIKSSGFFVLRNTLIPAILVEVGFITNPREENLLKTKSYREKIADGLAKGIVEYYSQSVD
ncbi:MAG: N-acetylmuramoyl-L-alanine amidase [Candidatus Omnitrophica bacterium]|nr:N-acetylmuramoyl-L-alanine amidase [Candidatus Omnitrophota bacterium]